MSDSDKIVLLKTFDLVIDADLAKAKLDAYGIPCILVNENTASIYPIPVNLLFGVRLMVFENDVETANEILNEKPEVDASVCPQCKSKNISFQFSQSWSARLATILSSFTFGIFMPIRKFRCVDCKHEFDMPENF